MIEFLIDNIFLLCLVDVFFNTVDIPMGTNCGPLVADLFLYSYEKDLTQGLLQKNEKKIARSFKFTFRYINDVLSLNNYRFLISLIASIALSLKLRILQIHIGLLYALTYTSKLTVRGG